MKYVSWVQILTLVTGMGIIGQLALSPSLYASTLCKSTCTTTLDSGDNGNKAGCGTSGLGSPIVIDDVDCSSQQYCGTTHQSPGDCCETTLCTCTPEPTPSPSPTQTAVPQ